MVKPLRLPGPGTSWSPTACVLQLRGGLDKRGGKVKVKHLAAALALSSTPSVNSTQLLKTSTTWNGAPIQYSTSTRPEVQAPKLPIRDDGKHVTDGRVGGAGQIVGLGRHAAAETAGKDQPREPGVENRSRKHGAAMVPRF